MLGRELFRVAGRGAVIVGLAAVGAHLLWLLAGPSVRDVGGAVRTGGVSGLASVPFAVVLPALCAAALLVCALWLAVVTVLVVLEVILGATAQGSTALCPDRVRRFVLAGCGAALVAGLATTPAAADPPDSQESTGSVGNARLGGLDLPDRVVGTAGPVAAPRDATRNVIRGDSLWSIAQDYLGERADEAKLDHAWRAIHRANLHRVGSDPDLIFPGTILHIPDLDPPHRKESS